MTSTVTIEMIDTKGIATIGVKEAILRSCVKLHADAVALCPVDLGQLRASIMFTVDSKEYGFNSVGIAADQDKLDMKGTETVGYVGTNSDHWYPEFGTRFQAAQPFMRPAGDLLRGGSAQDVSARYCQARMLAEFNRRRMLKI